MKNSSKRNIVSGVLKKFPLEAMVWILGLFLLAVGIPDLPGGLSLCLLKNLGFNYCPGCGLGQSVSYLFRGEFLHSIEAHPLGIVATFVLTTRIVSLFRKSTTQ